MRDDQFSSGKDPDQAFLELKDEVRLGIAHITYKDQMIVPVANRAQPIAVVSSVDQMRVEIDQPQRPPFGDYERR
jgi:hypothetical protein